MRLAKVFVPRHMRVVEGKRQDVESYTYQRRGGGTATVRQPRNAIAPTPATAKPISKGTGTEVQLPGMVAPNEEAVRAALKRIPEKGNVSADEVPNWENLSSRQPPTGPPGSVALHDTPGGEAFFQRIANAYDDDGRLVSTVQADIAKSATGNLKPGEVKALYVATRPDARRQGHATKLYDALQESGLDIVPAVGQMGVSDEGSSFTRAYLKSLTQDQAVTKLARVVVPPYVRKEDGKLVRVEGYTYQRDGGAVAALREKVTTGGLQKALPEESLADKVDIQDQRGPGLPELKIDDAKLSAAMDAVGIDLAKVNHIKLRFRDLHTLGSQGLTESLGNGNYRVSVGIKPKEAYEPQHLYVVNNSLVHELRHVTQMQQGNKVKYHPGDFQGENMQHAKANGYQEMEIEAQMFGRLAWDGPPEKKPLGPLGADDKHKGESVWAVTFGAVDPSKKPAPKPPAEVPVSEVEAKAPSEGQIVSTIEAAAKTVNFHQGDGKYNEQTLAKAAALKAWLAKQTDDKSSKYAAMLDEILKARAAKTKTPSKTYGKVK